MTRIATIGERNKITAIDEDPDHYRVITHGRGWAFGCGREWFEREQPAIGKWIVLGIDQHWHVEHEVTSR